MLIIPAIDIKNGKCVRLLQGDPEKETVYSDSPFDMAKKFASLGAKRVHVVDLDGAFDGRPVNHEAIIKMAAELDIEIEVGGGIRNFDHASMYIDAGVEKIIIGTIILEEGFRDFAEKYFPYIIAGVDARDGLVATHGWKNKSEINALDLIKLLHKMNITEVIYTDISTDGMLGGPNYISIENILKEVPGTKLVASGGISSLDDIRKLYQFKSIGLAGCILGKSIYDGRIDLKKAIESMKNWE